jgi:hypothetical protein
VLGTRPTSCSVLLKPQSNLFFTAGAAAAAVTGVVAAVVGCWLIDTAVGIAAGWSVLLEVAVDAEVAAGCCCCCEAVVDAEVAAGCCCCCEAVAVGVIVLKRVFTNAI